MSGDEDSGPVAAMRKLVGGLEEMSEKDAYHDHLYKKASALAAGEECNLDAFKPPSNFVKSKKKSKGPFESHLDFPNPHVIGPVSVPSDKKLEPIVDVKVVFSKKAHVPEGYELLETSVGGIVADCNKGNSKRVYLCYKRADPSDAGTPRARPITSLAVIFRDSSEEPPLGFRAVNKTVKGQAASLNAGTGNHDIFLCTARGGGAPIQDISIIYPDKKEDLPVGFNEVKHTPFGNKANLNSGTDGTSAYVCFRPNVQPALRPFRDLSKIGVAKTDVTKKYAQVLCVLAECLYSSSSHIVAAAMEAFKKIPSECPAPLINAFVTTVCDAAPCLLAFLTSKSFTLVLKTLLFVFKNHLSKLTIEVILKMFQTCFLIRHEDKSSEISKTMIDHLLGCIKRAEQAEVKPSKEEATTYDLCKSVVQEIVNNVRLPKRLEIDVARFQRGQRMGREMRADLVEFSRTLMDYENIAASDTITFPVARATEEESVTLLEAEEAEVVEEAGEEGEQEDEDQDPDEGDAEDATVEEGAENTSAAQGESVAAGEPSDPDSSPVEENDEQNDNQPNGDAAEAPPLPASLPVVEAPPLPTTLPPLEGINFGGAQDEAAAALKNQETLLAITLLLCKYTMEEAPLRKKKSETVKRKARGLNLLSHLMQKAKRFFLARPGPTFVIRRFVVPSIISCFVTDLPTLFQLVLKVFIVLYTHFKDILLIEIGVFVENIFIGLLDNRHTTIDQKKYILEVLLHIFKNSQDITNLWYNFDNHMSSWKVYEKLITTVSKIAEGDYQESLGKAQPGENNTGKNEDAQPEVVATATAGLEKLALKFLVHVLKCQAQWISVPGLPGSKAAEEERKKEEALASAGNNDPAAKGGRRKRASTWSLRYDKSKEQQKVTNDAINVAKKDGLTAALKYLKVVSPAQAVPNQLAKFLYNTHSLDNVEVGDVLGSLDDKFYTSEEYNELRREFLNLLDFTDLGFDDALRLFLVDSNFRLPGEAQKIDRLLTVFCVSYCKDNPGAFRSVDASNVLAFAVIMLNTDAHNPGIEKKKKMTNDQFASNLRGLDDGEDFPREYLNKLYANIVRHPIKIKEESSGAGDGGVVVPLTEEQRAVEWKKAFLLMVRKSHARLRLSSCEQHPYSDATSTLITKVMYEVSWFQFIAAITARVENTKDTELLHICLEGLGYGSTIAILLGLETERQAFTRLLAKITFLERNRKTHKGQDPAALRMRIVTGEHLKQDWYRPLNVQSAKYPPRACKAVLKVVQEIKDLISYERRQAVLRRIQANFGGDISLVEPNRSFVKEGKLTKIADRTGKPQEYTFFLFSDLILYASEGMNDKFKAHRVMHLSLCRLVNVQSDKLKFAFKITCPQKSITVCCSNEKKKQLWLDAILSQLKVVNEARKKYIDGLVDKKKKKETGSNGQSEDVLRRYSTFIGQSNMDIFSDKAGKKEAGHCKLCIKPFAFMRRRIKCKWCEDKICHECCTRKVRLPTNFKSPGKRVGKPVAVCDACFGVLNGMVGDNVPFITTQKLGEGALKKKNSGKS